MTFDWLDDPAEIKWLTEVSPEDVRKNAYRIYEFLVEGGLPPDSVLREAAFEKAADALGIPYDDLYNSWLEQRPLEAT